MQVGECINAIDGGFVTSPNIQDILVQTYPGKLMAFTPRGAGIVMQGLPELERSRPSWKRTNEVKVMTLNDERLEGYKSNEAQIERLKEEVGAESLRLLFQPWRLPTMHPLVVPWSPLPCLLPRPTLLKYHIHPLIPPPSADRRYQQRQLWKCHFRPLIHSCHFPPRSCRYQQG